MNVSEAGSAVLNVNDQGAFLIPNYTVTAGAVTRPGAAEIDYGFLKSLVLNTEFKAFPRLCAMAELDWTAAALKNYADFTTRLVTHKQRLAQLGITTRAPRCA